MAAAHDPWSHTTPLLKGNGDSQLHAAQRQALSAWPMLGPLEDRTGTRATSDVGAEAPALRNPRAVHRSFAEGLRESTPPRARPRARRPASPSRCSASPAGTRRGPLQVLVPAGTNSAAAPAAEHGTDSFPSEPRSMAHKGSPGRSRSRSRPRVVEVRPTPSAKPEWHVPSFKADVARLHVSQRERAVQAMRPDRC
jgi:hypothetical protein